MVKASRIRSFATALQASAELVKKYEDQEWLIGSMVDYEPSRGFYIILRKMPGSNPEKVSTAYNGFEVEVAE